MTSQNGASFIAQYGPEGDIGLLSPGRSTITIPAGRTVAFDFPVEAGLGTPEWFFDRRLSWPGVYQLQLIIPREQSVETSGEIISDSALLIIDEPHGEDTLVWNLMLEKSNGKGWGAQDWLFSGFGMAKEIWENHRTSAYVPHIALFVPGQSREEKTAIIEQTLTAHPDHPRSELFHQVLAQFYEDDMWHQLNVKGNPSAARKSFDLQKQHLTALSKSRWPAMRAKASERLMLTWDKVLAAKQKLDRAKER